MIRVLALTKYGRQAASTRQRLLQFEPALARAGYHITTSPFFDDAHVARLAAGKTLRIDWVLRAYGRRLTTLSRLSAYDLIWVHCEVLPYLPGSIELLWSRGDKPVIIDFDDAIFHMYDTHRLAPVRRLLGRKMLPLLRHATAVTVGNEYLAQYAQAVSQAVTVLPTVVDTSIYSPAANARSERLTVGWIGSPSTWRYAEQILPIILPITKAHGARFLAVGAGPAASRWPDVDVEPWSETTEVASVQAMHIGIMPLPDEKWARGKCGYKLIQYMSCGLPTVASPVGVNSDIVIDGETGLLASTSDQWRDALTRLLNDAHLRARMGAAGRERAVTLYSLAHVAPLLVSLFSSAVGRTA